MSSRRCFSPLIISHFLAFVFGGFLFRLLENNCITLEECLKKPRGRSLISDEGGNLGSVIPTDPIDGAVNVAELLENTRSRIRAELQHYNFSSSGAHRLENLVLESGGRPLRSVIIAGWGTGSTFLGEVLNAMPANFYHYEPLRSYNYQQGPENSQIRGPPHAERAIKILKSMLRCNYDNKRDLEEYFEYKKIHMQQFRHNTRMWEYCKQNKELCFDSDFTTKFCKLFPFQSMKLVRFRLHLVDELLKDEELNVKVVLLIRDPRAVFQSRYHNRYCLREPDCSDSELVCSDMVSDYEAAARLMQQYPDRIITVRYEELVLNPKTTSYELYSSLGLSVMPALDEFLDDRTTKELGGRDSTFRVSRDNAFKWKHLLDFNKTNSIQMYCKKAMRLWGYRMADNATHMQSKEFNPLDEYSVEPFTYT